MDRGRSQSAECEKTDYRVVFQTTILFVRSDTPASGSEWVITKSVDAMIYLVY